MITKRQRLYEYIAAHPERLTSKEYAEIIHSSPEYARALLQDADNKKSRWSEAEDTILIGMYNSNSRIEDISACLDRTNGSVRMRISILRSRGVFMPYHIKHI